MPEGNSVATALGMLHDEDGMAEVLRTTDTELCRSIRWTQSMSQTSDGGAGLKKGKLLLDFAPT